MSKKYYILNIKGKDPMPLIGPYKTFKGLLPKAKKICTDMSVYDSLYWVVIDDNSIIPPAVLAFSNKDLEIF